MQYHLVSCNCPSQGELWPSVLYPSTCLWCVFGVQQGGHLAYLGVALLTLPWNSAVRLCQKGHFSFRHACVVLGLLFWQLLTKRQKVLGGWGWILGLLVGCGSQDSPKEMGREESLNFAPGNSPYSVFEASVRDASLPSSGIHSCKGGLELGFPMPSLSPSPWTPAPELQREGDSRQNPLSCSLGSHPPFTQSG